MRTRYALAAFFYLVMAAVVPSFAAEAGASGKEQKVVKGDGSGTKEWSAYNEQERKRRTAKKKGVQTRQSNIENKR